MKQFDIPVVLVLFTRIDKPLKLLEQIAKVAPSRLYLLSDGGRTMEEHKQVEACRAAIEAAISWSCEVIKKYEAHNIGIYANIGEGAKWVFQREESAIFLEDDNFPEVTFFRFCEEMLERYRSDSRVLWVCGTNYLKEYKPVDGASYLFTQNMMPCGWASWSEKFIKCYDGELELWQDPYIRARVKEEYRFPKLYCQDKYNIEYELDARAATGRFYSWDYQMSFSVRAHNMYAIVPGINQIKNIGVDNDSTHGGTSLDDIMVQRFCELPTKPLVFPLVHPKSVLIDLPFEVQVAKVILSPDFFSFRSRISRWLREVLGISKIESVGTYLKKRIGL